MKFLLAAVISGLATFFLVRYAHQHWRITVDVPVGPQKFHSHAVSRIGGIGILAGYLGSLALVHVFETSSQGQHFVDMGALLLLCSLPALGAGLAEDVTKRVGVIARLLATMLAAGIAYFALDGVLERVDVAGLDSALKIGLVSFAFSIVAVGGIANAVNIVDGYNGLAAFVAILVFAALAYVSWVVGDAELMQVSFTMAGALIGFLIWNFPRGAIFLGDGGAYFIGFMIGEVSVLLVRRHPEVSPWFPLMLMAYPVWETLFSIYRKRFYRGQSPGEADGLHFHQLVYKRVIRWKVGSRHPLERLQRNSLTSPYLWIFALTTIVPAVLFWNNSVVLGFSAFGFAALYGWLYRRMVCFHVPKFLIIRKPRVSGPQPLLLDEIERFGPK